MYFLWREALLQDIWNWFLGEARGGLLHSYMRCTCERPTNHLNKSEHKKGHGLMHWGAHVEGSDACWHFHTSAEPPPRSSTCPQTPLKWDGVCSLTLPAWTLSPGDLPRCAAGLGQSDSLAGVQRVAQFCAWALWLCLGGFWWCYVTKRSHNYSSVAKFV